MKSSPASAATVQSVPSVPSMPLPPKPSNRIEVLDFIRGLAIIHIIFYHYFLEWFRGFFHGNFLIVPDGVIANISQLTMFHDGGVLGLVKNIFGFLFAYGFFSVNLFLLLSGFVLTLSALRSNMEISSLRDLGLFYWKKLKRIVVPMYISILIGIGFLYLRNFLFPQFAANPIYTLIDIVKLLFAPFLVYDMPLLQKFNGDLWFITIILQFYILFPLLQYALKKFGVWKFLACAFVLTVGYRYFATYGISAAPMGVMYPSQYGYTAFSFFLPRLFEFACGMGLAAVYFKRENILQTLMSGPAFLIGIILSCVGFMLDMYRWGWPYADLTVSIGLFLFFLNLGARLSRLSILRKSMLILSDLSYDIFLLHHYLINYFLMPLLLVLGLQNEMFFWIAMPLFFIGSVGLGWVEQKIGSVIG